MIKHLALIFLLSLLWLCPAEAGLLGDTITFAQYIPDLSHTSAVSSNITVTAGTSDDWHFYTTYTANPEDTRILVSFTPGGSAIFSGTTFNGLGVNGIDTPIAGVSISTNLAGWNDSRLIYGADYLRFNWQGLTINNGSYFTANLTFGSKVVTPEPASLSLLGIGLLGLLARKRVKTVLRAA